MRYYSIFRSQSCDAACCSTFMFQVLCQPLDSVDLLLLLQSLLRYMVRRVCNEINHTLVIGQAQSSRLVLLQYKIFFFSLEHGGRRALLQRRSNNSSCTMVIGNIYCIRRLYQVGLFDADVGISFFLCRLQIQQPVLLNRI